MLAHPLEEILHPRSIAVTGASDNPFVYSYHFVSHLLNHGYRGKVYLVNPNRREVFGIKAYPSIKDIPGPVDYVISCIPASGVLSMLDDCSAKEVKAVHLYTARFSETGRPEASELEQEILKRARKLGIRLIGPNCMGIYYPRGGLTFGYHLPPEPGPVGLAAQTGGGSASFVHMASLRGVRFSKAISYGNAADLNESDLLDYFSQDQETKIILMYIEGVRDGSRFINTLRKAASSKPVIIVKGGRGESGTRAAASHTASIAGSAKTWEAIITQAGAISAQNFDEMADLAVSFCFLPALSGLRVGISGGSGGPTVRCADECEEAGLDVINLPMEIREEIKSKSNGIQVWDWVSNPIDMSILEGSGITDVDILRMMARNQNFDLLIVNLNEDILLTTFKKEQMISMIRNNVKGYINVKEGTSKPLLIVVGEKGPSINDNDYWSWKLIREVRTKLIAADIPFYPTMERAARAARRLIEYYQYAAGEKPL